MQPAEHQVVATILTLAKQAKNDPLRAQVILQQIESEAFKLHSEFGGEIGKWRTMRVPNLATLGPAGGGADVSTTGQAKWPFRALVGAAYGCILGDSLVSGVGASFVGWNVLLKGGDKSLVQNGQGSDFMLFTAAFGFSQNWYPIGEEVSGTDTTWGVHFRNLDPAASYTPEFYFRFFELPAK